MAWSLLPPQYRPLEYGPSETQDPSAIFWACVDSSILSSKSLTYWNDLRTRNDRINVVSPRLHHPCAVLEIGCLVVRGTDLVALLVRRNPCGEKWPKPRRLRALLSAVSESGLASEVRPGKTHFEPLASFLVWRNSSSACCESGTMCISFAFIRSAGMRHSAESKSISLQVA